MARKDHLITIQEDSKLSKKFLARNNAIAFQAQVPTIAQQINGIGAASKTPDEVKDTKFPVLNPIDEIGKNLSAALNIDLSLENSPFHCLELSDVGDTITDLAIDFINLVKNKAERFILDITKDPGNVSTPTITFDPPVENLPAGFPSDDPRYLLEIVARETPTETRFEVVNQIGTTGVTFPLTPDIKVHGNVTGAVTVDLALITAHYHTMTLTGNITFTFSNPPINNREISFILDITQDGTGGRTVTWPVSVRVDPTVGSGANARTVIIVTTVDNGTNYDALIVTGGEVNAANKQLSNLGVTAINTSLISDTDNTDDLGSDVKKWKDLHIGGIANIDTLAATTMSGDLNMGTFDIFNVDIVQFALGGASLLSTDVGFDANVNGGITTNILTDVGGNWKVTEEGSTRLIYDTANNAFQVQDVNPLISLQETGTSTAFTISKIAGRTDISEPTEIQFQIAVTNIFEVLSTGITMADNKFIANVDQIGFRITGNFIEDDASGLRLITVPTDFVMMGDGTDTFMTVQNTHFDIGGRYWQLNAIASPGVTGSATLGRVFIDSGNSNHLSIIRNAAIIDLEAAATGANQQLSNLSGTVAVNLNLIPNQATGGNLGSSTLTEEWFNLYTGRIQFPQFITPVTSIPSIQWVDLAIDEFRFNTPTGDIFGWWVGVVQEMELSNTTLKLEGVDLNLDIHDITGIGTTISWNEAGQSITSNTSGLDITTPAGDFVKLTPGTTMTAEFNDFFFRLKNTSTTQTPQIILHFDDSAPAIGNILGRIDFDGEDSVGTQTTYARIIAEIKDPANTSEDGIIRLQVVNDNTITTVFEGAGLPGGGTPLIAFRNTIPQTVKSYSRVTTTTDRAVSDTSTIGTQELGNILGTLLKDLSDMGIITGV